MGVKGFCRATLALRYEYMGAHYAYKVLLNALFLPKNNQG